MKVLFLDIDGVLNNMYSMVQYKAHLWPPLVYKLNEISNSDTDVKVVVSSSWRILFSDYDLKVLLGRAGWSRSDLIIGTTPRASRDDNTRGNEIQKWLDAHPEVTHYAIVDDDSDMLESQMPHFVNTTYELGLIDSDVKKIKKILEI
jgi:hypothetical protein